jgi:uncharacterized protein (DUF58 family)
VDPGVRLPDHCFAGQSFPMSVSLRNHKRLFPSFSFTVAPVEGGPFEFDDYYVPIVRNDATDSRTVLATLPNRGRFDVGKLRIRSRYPFGFLLKGRNIDVTGGTIAFPRLLPPESMDLVTRDILGSSERFERGHGMDLYMIREYLPSDSARHVDWKASAKTAQMKTREFAAEDSRRVLLVFDRYGQAADRMAFEKNVSEAASLALYLVQDGAEVTLVSDDWNSGPVRTDAQAESILRYLALVEMEPHALAPERRSDAETVRFSLRPASGMLETRAFRDN